MAESEVRKVVGVDGVLDGGDGDEDVDVDLDLFGLVLPERIERSTPKEDAQRGEFVMEPLERGFGHTLGNSMRRVLLSSLRGAAVWAFRIDGVVHEHQTIPGVVEDVHQVIQNLKALVLILEEQADRATLTIQAKGAGTVTAADIALSPYVELLEPDHHLLTLQDDRELNIELHVNKGRGLVLAHEHALPAGAPVDLVRIDSIYNPVRRANFRVDETRVGQRTDFDRLTISVETDGSLDPEDAVEYGAHLMRKHLEYMLYFGEGGLPEPPHPGKVAVSKRVADLFERPIDDLAELSIRSRNSLEKQKIHTVRDLVQTSEEKMLNISNFGKKSMGEIHGFIEKHGLFLGMVIEEDDRGGLLIVIEEVASEIEERPERTNES